MKIMSATPNNRKRVFEVETALSAWTYPYAKAQPQPTREDSVAEVFVDDELGAEGFTYRLASGVEGSIHVEQVLEYNRDPSYMRDLLLYELTVEARERLKGTPLSKREIIRRLGTSPAQFYRLLDTTDYRKSVDGVLALLSVLDCDVSFVVNERSEPFSTRGG